jgi:hypothetical protein
MNELEMKQQAKRFGLRGIRLAEPLPRRRASDAPGSRLFCPAPSGSPNDRAVRRARFRAAPSAKPSTAGAKPDEPAHWMKRLSDAGMMSKNQMRALPPTKTKF